MALRIERDTEGETTKLRLSGRLRSEGLEELRRQMEGGGTQIVLDLEDVTLVDATTVAFLAGCELKGVTLRRVPPYLREWILRQRDESA